MQSDTSEPTFEPEASSDSAPAQAEMPQAELAGSPSVDDAKGTGAKPVKVKKPGRSRALVRDLLVTFLLVGAITVSVGSTLVALNAVKQRDQLETQAAKSSAALDGLIKSVASSSRLKGPAAAQARVDLFAPTIAYYQSIVDQYGQDPEHQDQVADASYHLATLHAKTGNPRCVADLQAAFEALRVMGEQKYPIEKYPSLYEIGLSITTPMEWAIMKDTKIEDHGMALMFTILNADSRYGGLSKQYPESTKFLNDHAGVLRISATLQSLVPARVGFAARDWRDSSAILERMLQADPGNVDLQTRLIEALVGASNLERATDKESAVTHLQRAVEVRQMMVDASPDDSDLAKDLSKLKSNLEKLAASAKEDSASASAEDQSAVQ